MKLTVHTERAFSVAQFLSADECAELIALAEAQGFIAAGVRTREGPKAMPMIRNNERVLLASPHWVALLWQRLSDITLPVLDGEIAVGLPRDLRFYKYTPGQRFKMHKDGPWTEDGMVSKLTMLVYLNEEFTGGSTDFRDCSIQPETGSALFFIHDTWHEGAAIQDGYKYVLRSDVLYAPRNALIINT
ncbi:prolyl hydroxylase family protein [Undibacterium sp. TJN19]|uniref:prolyl hydroxylase family protein n=1 Tax=Undibacterium sp. TJN19 TaxID=3413055 RepID=UPI003BF22A0F